MRLLVPTRGAWFAWLLIGLMNPIHAQVDSTTPTQAPSAPPTIDTARPSSSWEFQGMLLAGQNGPTNSQLFELINDDFLDDQEKQGFLDALPESARAGYFSMAEFSVPLPGNKHHITLGFQQLRSLQFNRSLAELALFGNGHQLNATWDLGKSAIRSQTASWIGLRRTLQSEQLTLQLGGNLIFGHDYFGWDGSNSALYTDSTAEFLTLYGDHRWQGSSNSFVGGLGVGLSLAGHWESKSGQWSSRLSAQNLGAIYWMNPRGTSELIGGDSTQFNGLFVDNLLVWEPDNQEVLDSLTNQYVRRDSTSFLKGMNAPLQLSVYHHFNRYTLGLRGFYVTHSLMSPRIGIVTQFPLDAKQSFELYGYWGGFEPWGLQLGYSYNGPRWAGSIVVQQAQSLIPALNRGLGFYLQLRKNI